LVDEEELVWIYFGVISLYEGRETCHHLLFFNLILIRKNEYFKTLIQLIKFELLLIAFICVISELWVPLPLANTFVLVPWALLGRNDFTLCKSL